MGVFSFGRVGGLVGCVLSAGCSTPQNDLVRGDSDIPELRSEPFRESKGSSADHFDRLPRFVNGGLRCGVAKAPPRNAVPSPGGDLSGAAPIPSIHAANPESANCSGPGPLCALFGPSKTDVENHRLRRRLNSIREQHEKRAKQLRTQVRQAEAAAEAERRSRIAQLRGLGVATEEVYLTNDDSMSLASPQRLIWAIDHEAPLPSEQVRPHELLNYFSFKTLPVNAGEEFSVLPELSPHPMRPSDLTLGFSVRGRSVTKETRRNVSLTYVLDRSGSMAGGHRIETMKRGVIRSFEELKDGDMVSLVLFDSTTCPLARNFVVGRDAMGELTRLVKAIKPRGGSNLQDGLDQGYAVANRSYQAGYSNRVLLITDVEASGAFLDEKLVRLSARNYDARRVRLSAVGVGDTVSDELLDRLTEAGKGASVFLSSDAELEAIFGVRFTSLVETIATNVHFQLELPPSIGLRAFYGEEAASKKERVQAVHFFSGTKQMYLANLEKSRALEPSDYIRLSIEYDDPDTGQPKSSRFSWRADELAAATGERSKFEARNLNKARMVATFGYQLRHMAETYSDLLSPRQAPTWTFEDSETIHRSRAQRWAEAVHHCRRVKGRLDAFAAQLRGAPEAARIVDLWHRYCSRYDEPEGPLELASPGTSPRHLTSPSERHAQLREDLSTLRINDFAPQPDDI